MDAKKRRDAVSKAKPCTTHILGRGRKRRGEEQLKNKAIILGSCIILLVTFILSGCGGEKKQADVIKIGANLEMTGGNASFGQSATNGAKLAIKEVNAKGGVLGKQLTLIVADNKSEAAEAALEQARGADASRREVRAET